MQSKSFIKLFLTICFCISIALAFSACKNREVFADNSDFESYPEYWNSFNKTDDSKSDSKNTSDIISENTTNSSNTNSDVSSSNSSDLESISDDEHIASAETDSDNDFDNTSTDTDDTDDKKETNNDNQGTILFF